MKMRERKKLARPVNWWVLWVRRIEAAGRAGTIRITCTPMRFEINRDAAIAPYSLQFAAGGLITDDKGYLIGECASGLEVRL